MSALSNEVIQRREVEQISEFILRNTENSTQEAIKLLQTIIEHIQKGDSNSIKRHLEDENSMPPLKIAKSVESISTGNTVDVLEVFLFIYFFEIE